VLATLRDLVQHKNHANAALLSAIAVHDPAASDPELQRQLHHVVLANRFWLALITDSAFDLEREQASPQSLDAIWRLFQDIDERETSWMAALQPSDLEREVVTPFLPGQSFSLTQALLQVCLHTHGHRAQCATRLRELGGTPPAMDFVAWLKDRPAAGWPPLVQR
jgi:uncharacterized damage-inducible protein DinB